MGGSPPKKIAYLELVTPSLDSPQSLNRALYWLNRDFPWVVSEGWAVEWWGVRAGDGAKTSPHGLRVRGPRVPFRRVPWGLLGPLAWVTHFVLTLFNRDVGVVVARHPYLAPGATLARALRRSAPALVVRIIERIASKALRVYRSGVVFRVIDAVDRFVLRRADLVILMGGFTDELARRAGVASERTVELPHPVLWGDPDATENVPREPERVVCAARFIVGKGIDVLIRAFALVLQRFPDATLDIAGDGPERPQLERLVGELGIQAPVSFPGWVQPAAMPVFLGRATVAVLPSRVEEGHPMALQEAALAGCALVGTNHGGIRDIIRPGITGTLVPPEDPRALAEALCSYLEDPAAARRAGSAARTEALAYYARRDAAVEELQQRFHELTARRR